MCVLREDVREAPNYSHLLPLLGNFQVLLTIACLMAIEENRTLQCLLRFFKYA